MPRNPFSERGIRRTPAGDEDEERAFPAPAEEQPDKGAQEEDLGEPEVAEAVGATLEEAIQNALEILGAPEDEVEVEILAEGRRPLFGIGKSRPFRVRVFWQEDLDEEVIEEEVSEEESSAEPPASRLPQPPPAIDSAPDEEESRPPADPLAGSPESLAARAREVTEDLLRRMGVSGSVSVESGEGEILVEVQSEEDDALLIGRGGETRAALQHVIQRLVLPRDHRGVTVLLDVNGYWERRVERLREDALAMAQLAIDRGEEVRTDALSAQERRIVHRALAQDLRVRTESIGDGALKRVSILPVHPGARQ